MLYSFFIFVLSSLGITFIVTYSSIFEPIRDYVQSKSDYFGELISCPMCAGFWVGLFVSIISYSDFNPIYFGAIISFFCWITSIVVNYINVLIISIEDNAYSEE